MLAQTFRPHVAFIDIGMADLSGYEVARSLRQEPWATRIFLVALTGWEQDDDEAELLGQ
jgi:CheY-like chemotaxis protein